jgi:hypothetical protein
LRAQAKRLYHMGLRCKTVSRNTLSTRVRHQIPFSPVFDPSPLMKSST